MSSQRRNNDNAFTPHRHECPDCGTIWNHDPNSIEMQNEIAYELSHHCPNCGAEQRYVYDGFEESHCMHNGFRQVWALSSVR